MSKQVKSALLVCVALGIVAFVIWHFVTVKQQGAPEALPGGQSPMVRGR